MARLKALPGLDVIKGFRGVLDFYYWRGLPCVRAWPRGKALHRTDAEIASALLFGAIIKAYNLLGDGPLEAYREAAIDNPRTARDIYVSGVLGHLHERTLPAPPPPPEEEMYDAYLCLRDKKPKDTHGGTFTSGAFQTRDLTEKQADPQHICVLDANQFVLLPGSYRAMISCPAYKVNGHQTRLYNVTAAATLLLGSCERVQTEEAITNRSILGGRFTVAADQALEVQHYCSSTYASAGFGTATGFTDEIYTIAEFWREIEPE